MPEVLDAAALSDAMGEQAVTCPSPAAGEAGIMKDGGWEEQAGESKVCCL